MALAARTSWTTPMVVFSTTTATMMTASEASPQREDDAQGAEQQQDHRVPQLLQDAGPEAGSWGAGWAVPAVAAPAAPAPRPG